MDPARGGNLLRFINDYVGMPGAVPCSCMMVEVMDCATLRPHIFFFAAVDVPAGEELLLDYGDVSVLACPHPLFFKFECRHVLQRCGPTSSCSPPWTFPLARRCCSTVGI